MSKRLIAAAKKLREDLLLRADIEDEVNVVNASAGIWDEFKAAIEEADRAPGAEPKLDAPAKIGSITFDKGVPWSTVIDFAQRNYQRFKSGEQFPFKSFGELIKAARLTHGWKTAEQALVESGLKPQVDPEEAHDGHQWLPQPGVPGTEFCGTCWQSGQRTVYRDAPVPAFQVINREREKKAEQVMVEAGLKRPAFPDIGCSGDCGFEVRGAGLQCCDGDACKRYLHPGDEGFAEVFYYYDALNKRAAQEGDDHG